MHRKDSLSDNFFARTKEEKLLGKRFNKARETTFEFMEKFLASVRGDFPDKNIHIGGDEVDISCWLEFLVRGFFVRVIM